MAGGLQVTVRQVASYPQALPNAQDLALLQQGGLGGPYAAVTVGSLISAGLIAGPALGVGTAVPADAAPNQVFTGNTVLPLDGSRYWNCYVSPSGGPYRYFASGVAGADGFDGTVGFDWLIAAPGAAGAPFSSLSWSTLMRLSPAGALSLPFGTLSVARDPGGAMEVANMGWVGANTVASFNGRRGVVQLTADDVYAALCLDPCDPFITVSQTNAAICAAIQQLLAHYPGVSSLNGRFGNVFINTCDLNIATFSGPASGLPALMLPTPVQPTDPTPADPLTAVNIAWVEAYVTALTTTGDFATKAYVDAAVAASVVSFNGRTGAVLLQLSDITSAGGAPTASPIFSGVPTAPTAAAGSATSQVATTAFVMAAVSNATAGVASFNGRTGAVTLNSTDLNNAGGALLASPNFSGTPTAPTPAVGNSSTQIATTAFVTAALAGFSGVTSFNSRTGAVTLALADITGAGGAPLASPALSGTPTAPTAAAGTNNTQVATTAFVEAAIAGIGPGVSSFEGRTGAVTLQANDIQAAGGLVNPSVALTGTPTAPTPSAGNSSTQIATTAFVTAAVLTGSVTSFNTRTGAVTLQATDISGAGGALLASPAFTGTPTAPTAAPATSTTQIATTAFVTAALTTQAANSVTSFNGRQGVVTLTTADITGAGGAPIANPTFTGTPAVPTAAPGTATTQAASTAFVMAAIAAQTAGVTSFNSRTGAVTLQTNDVSAVGGALLASPTFTGTPTAPTPAPGDNSTNIATTAFVMNALSASAVTSFNTRTGAVTLTSADVSGAGGLLATGGTVSGNLTVQGTTTLAFPTNITGATNGSNATAGTVGEYQQSLVTTGVGAPGSNAAWNVTQLTLGAGDWELWGEVWFSTSGASTTQYFAWINTVSATAPTISQGPMTLRSNSNALIGNENLPVAVRRYSLTASTTFYLTATANYNQAAATMAALGILAARRIR